MEKGIYFQSSDCKIPTTHDPPEIEYIYILNYATFLNRLSHALFFSRWEVVALLHPKIKAKLQCSFRSSIPLAPNCSNQKEAKSCHPPEKLCTCVSCVGAKSLCLHPVQYVIFTQLSFIIVSNQYSNYISSKPLTATPGSRHFHWCLWCFFPTAEDIRIARARLLEYQGTARQRHQGSVFGQISREPRASPRFLHFGGLQTYC